MIDTRNGGVLHRNTLQIVGGSLWYAADESFSVYTAVLSFRLFFTGNKPASFTIGKRFVMAFYRGSRTVRTVLARELRTMRIHRHRLPRRRLNVLSLGAATKVRKV